MRRTRLLGVLLGAALVASLFAASPAQAAVGPCNSNFSLGVNYASAVPAGSTVRRNLWVKVCVVYSATGHTAATDTTISCRLNDAATPCDVRASVERAKLDGYTNDGDYYTTFINQPLNAGTGYASQWHWNGAVYHGAGSWPCSDVLQANDFDIWWRLGADGVLRHYTPGAFSAKASPC